MADSSQSHVTLQTGRPLNDSGKPIDGPALEMAANSREADLFQMSSRPLASHPGAGTWGNLLERPDEGKTDSPVLLQWLSPGSTEPPVHVHPTRETFEVLRGTLTVAADGEIHRLDSGREITISANVEHTFRNETDKFVTFRAELPSMKTVKSLYTTWGRDHERVFSADDEFGEPGLLHGLVLSEDLYNETTMKIAPLPAQRLLWMTVGRAARAVGYSGIDESYLKDEFWKRHVEQPEFGNQR